MSISISVRTDTLRPGLARAARKLADPKPLLEAMGLALVATSQAAFADPSLRPTMWRARRDGSAATLRRTGTLWRSIRIASVTSRSVTVGSDRKYAAIHQVGGVIRPKSARALVFRAAGRTFAVKKVTIPARPFMPFGDSGAMTARGKAEVRAAAEKKLASLLRS